METVVRYVWSAILITVGACWIIRREVGIGIAGSPPSFFARGTWATVLGFIAIAIGLVALFRR